MRVYRSDEVRNVALAGHSGSGTTTLTAALLYINGVVPKPGSVEARNTQSDYDPQEQARHISINLAVIPLELPNHKINLIDCPGSRDFVGDMKNGIRVGEMALVVVDAVHGSEVGTEFAWEYAAEYLIPRAVFINKMDKERASFSRAMETIARDFDARCVPITLPIGEGPDFKGVVDLFEMKAVYPDGTGVRMEEIPEAMREEANAARRALVEAAAEGDDQLTEKFLLEENLSLEEIMTGLREDLEEGRFCPVVCGSATTLAGIWSLQRFFVNECPPPFERKGFRLQTEDGSRRLRKLDPVAPFSAFVFKTINDDYAGRLSLFKVVSGEIVGDGMILNSRAGKTERVGHVFDVRGKSQLPVERVVTGDIGAFAKLEVTHTGDTIQDAKAEPVVYEPTVMPQATTHAAIHTKNRGDEEKLSMALHRLLESDPTLRVERDGSLHQTVISGMGDTHLDVAVSRLKAATRIEVELLPPRVPYRETITRKGEGQGKYKKQSGGRGQYGDCHIRFEPLPRGSAFEFVWEIVGGVIPTNFKGSVEKGLIDAMQHGVLAGYPVVDVKAACYYGSYHDVDSSDMAFQVAASLAYKNVLPNCGPVVLEPYLTVSVTVPDTHMGDVMGYISQRRGRISGNEQNGHKVVIHAEVPQGEMATFSRDLRSMTQGRGVFETRFSHYEACPPPVQEKVIAEAQRHAAELAAAH